MHQAFVENGAVSGVPLKSGAIWVKRAVSGEVVMVARGFWRARGLALDGLSLFLSLRHVFALSVCLVHAYFTRVFLSP